MTTDPVPAASDPTAALIQSGWARSLARSLVRDDFSADDLVQDAWLANQGNPATVRSPENWLQRVLRNGAAMQRRTEARRREREQRVARTETQEDRAGERARMQRCLAEAVEALDADARTMIVLRYFEDHSPRAIAVELGISATTARKRLQRAHEKLRLLLRDRLGDDWKQRCLVVCGPSTTGWIGGWGLLTMSMTTKTLLAGGLLIAVGAVLWPDPRSPEERSVAPASKTGLEARSVDGNPAVTQETRQDLARRAAAVDQVDGTDLAAEVFGWTGRVLDDHGQAIPGARVQARNREEPFAISDAAGRYLLPWPMIGDWREIAQVLQAAHPDFAPIAVQAPPDPQRPAARVDFRLDPGLPVTVVVVDDRSGAALPGVEVHLLHGDAGAENHATSDALGMARFRTPGPGMHLVRPATTAPVLPRKYHERYVDPSSEEPIELRVLPYPTRIQARAVDAETGAVLAHAQFERARPGSLALDRMDRESAEWLPLASEEGSIDWVGDPNDLPCVLRVRAPDHHSRRFLVSAAGKAPIELALPPAGTHPVQLVRNGEPAHEVARVAWGLTSPLELVPDRPDQDLDLVRLVMPLDADRGSLHTDARGRARLPLEVGRSQSGHRQLELTVSAEDGSVITVRGTDFMRFDPRPWRIELEPRHASVRIRVYDAEDGPAVGARVNLLASVDPETAALDQLVAGVPEPMYTGADGTVALQLRTPFESLRAFTALDGEHLWSEFEALPPAGKDGVHELVIRPEASSGGIIRGTLLDHAGHPVEESAYLGVGAYRMIDGILEEVDSATARAGGRFEFAGLEPGLYVVRADLDPLAEAREVLVGETPVEIEVRLPPRFDLYVSLTDARSGEAVAGAEVVTYDDRGEMNPHYLRSDGEVVVTGLGPSTETVLITAPGFAATTLDLRARRRLPVARFEVQLQPARRIELHFPGDLAEQVVELAWLDPPGGIPVKFWSPRNDFQVWEHAPPTAARLQAYRWGDEALGPVIEIPAGIENLRLEVPIDAEEAESDPKR